MQDVGQVIWSSDDPELCAIRERELICILRNAQPEQWHESQAALCSFADLELKVTIHPIAIPQLSDICHTICNGFPGSCAFKTCHSWQSWYVAMIS